MIIWINGAFGAGKTTIATKLVQMIPNSYLYDPGNIGDFFRNNLPVSIQRQDFQEYTEWRTWNVHMLKKISDEYSGDVIVPMTIYDGVIYDEIINELRRQDVSILYFQLEVSREVIVERLQERNSNLIEWGMSKVDKILAYFENVPKNEKIDNEHQSIDQVANMIIERLYQTKS